MKNEFQKFVTQALLAIVIGIEAWNLKETVDLKVKVAELSVQVRGLSPKTQNTIALK